MKNEIVMQLFSRRVLTEQIASSQIRALSDFEDGLMRPEKCDLHEPIRMAFNADDLREPVRWLTHPSAWFMYKKGKPTNILGWIKNEMPGEVWVSEGPGKPSRLAPRRAQPIFVNNWTSYFDGTWSKKIGIEKVRKFSVEMFRASESEFGFLTTSSDLDAKNYLITEQEFTKSVGYEGLDPEHGMPGLYWITIFGPRLVSWLGAEALTSGPGLAEQLESGAILLQFGESPDDCRSSKVLDEQRRTIERLGEMKFFDIRFPNRKLESPNWDG